MTDNENNHSPEEKLAAMLGLLADDTEPNGPTPSLQEIQNWHLGKLDAQRAAEVKSHVARDPACYQMWSDLVASEKETEVQELAKQDLITSLMRKMKMWWMSPPSFWIGSGLVTTAIVVLAVIIVPVHQTWSPIDDPVIAELGYEWPYESLSVTRGGELSYRQKIAMQTGIRSGIEITTQSKAGWDVAIKNLPNETLNCDKETNKNECEQQTRLLHSIGLHAGVMYMACLDYEKGQQKYFDSSYWQELTTAWRTMAGEVHKANIESLIVPIRDISLSQDKQQQCGLVRDVIYMSY